MVSLMMSLASHDGDTNHIPWPKSHVAFPFDHLDPTNGMVPLMTLGMMWHWHQCQWHCMTKKLHCTLFQLSGPNEYSGAIDNTIDITWWWCQFHMSKDWKGNVAPCFNHLDLANKVVPLTVPTVSSDAKTGASSITCHKLSMSHLVSIVFT